MTRRITICCDHAVLAAFLGCLALTALAASPAAADNLPAAEPAVSRQIADRLAAPVPLVVEGIVVDRGLLSSLYAARADAPIWADHQDWPADLANALADAGSDGIAPASLGLPALQRALSDPTLGTVDRELLLTDRYLALGAALARGRIAIASIEDDWALSAPEFDAPAAVALLEQEGGPGAALRSLAPASPGYERLKTALARYAQYVATGGWASLPADTDLEPGDQGPQVKLLRKRLAAEGELPADLTESEVFDPVLAVAVAGFQSRHGLLVDSHVGPATLAALNVSAENRRRQISINLERLRAMPHEWPATRIEVQTALQTLALYRDGKTALTSRVIDGAPNHPTPVLAAAVERVVLDPAWDVPASITRREIQPRLRRDPGYLARNHYVILGRGGGDPAGQDVDWATTDILAMGWRLRQLPGPWNALGSVMLDMPNRFDVYLHDTPARNLFALPARALSHGCVRVEAVRELAAALLGAPLPAPGGPTRGVPLAQPMPVYFLYQTALVDEDGTVELRDDIYGRDARLAAALDALERGTPSGAPGPPPALTVAKSCPKVAANLAALTP